jgi:hypothetical protein
MLRLTCPLSDAVGRMRSASDTRIVGRWPCNARKYDQPSRDEKLAAFFMHA